MGPFGDLSVFWVMHCTLVEVEDEAVIVRVAPSTWLGIARRRSRGLAHMVAENVSNSRQHITQTLGWTGKRQVKRMTYRGEGPGL